MSGDQLSAHFRRAELACRCGCGLYVHQIRKNAVIPNGVAAFFLIRSDVNGDNVE